MLITEQIIKHNQQIFSFSNMLTCNSFLLSFIFAAAFYLHFSYSFSYSFSSNFSKNSTLDDSGISLPVFTSRTNLKLHNIYVTPKMVKKVIMNIDLSKESSPDCIPVVVLKNC